MPVTEQDALRALEAAKLAADDPARVAKAKSIVDAYRTEQSQLGKPLFPTYYQAKADDQRKVRSFFQDRDRHGLDDEQYREVAQTLQDPEKKARFFNEQFLARTFQRPTQEIRKLGAQYRDEYALQAWGEPVKTESEFYQKLGEDFDTEDQIADLAQTAALQGIPAVQAWAQVPDEIKTNPAFQRRQKALLAEFEETAAATDARISPYRQVVTQTIEDLRETMKGAPSDEERAGAALSGGLSAMGAEAGREISGAMDFRDFAQRLVEIPKEDRDLVIAAIIAGAGDGDAKGPAQKLAENFARGVQSIAADTVGAIDRTALRQLQSFANQGAGVDGDATTVQGYLQGLNARLAAASDPTGAAALAAGMSEKTAPSEEIRAQAAALIETQMEAIDVANDLQQIADGVIDPAKGEYMVTRGLYAAARSIPYTLVAMAPGGIAVNTVALSEQSYQTMRRANPDMSRDEAMAISAIAGPIQAGLEQIPAAMLAGKLPTLGRFMNKAVATTGGAATRFGVRTAEGVAIEMVQENLQDLTPFAVQGTIAALSDDMPDVPWNEVYGGDFWNQQGELFFATLPLALIGAGAGTVRDFTAARSLMTRPREVALMIGDTAKATEIADLAKDGKYDQAQSILREEMRKTGKDTKAIQEVRIEAAQALRAEAETQREAIAKGEELAIIPVVSPVKEGWMVRFNDGTERTFPTYTEANEARWKNSGSENLKFHRDITDTISHVDRSQREGRGVRYVFGGQRQTLLQSVESGKVSREAALKRADEAEADKQVLDVTVPTDDELKASVESEYEEGTTVAQIKALSEDDRLAAVTILGSNTTEFENGIYVTTAKLQAGATWATVIEEKLEGDAIILIKQGEERRNWLVKALRDFEKSSGEQIFRSGVKDEDLTDGDIKGAHARAGIAYFVGTSGEAGGFQQSRKFQKRFDAFVKAGLSGSIEGYARFFMGVALRADSLNKLRREGKLDADLERELARSVGFGEQAEYEASVETEAAALLREMEDSEMVREPLQSSAFEPTDDAPFSVIATSRVQEVTFDDILKTEEIEGDESALPELMALAEKFGLPRPLDAANILERWVESGIAQDQGATKADAVKARELLTRYGGGYIYPPEVDEFYYHVTTKRNAKAILKSGEIKAGQSAQFSTAATQSNSQGRVFVSERSGVQFWADRIQEQLDDRESREKLTVLRIPKALVIDPKIDDALERRNDSFYTESPIPTKPQPITEGPSFSVITNATDSAYLAAVESGDMEAAQRMVDEAARAAGYDTQTLYHNTDAAPEELAKGFSLPAFFTPDFELFSKKGKNKIKVYVDRGNEFRPFSRSEEVPPQLMAQGYGRQSDFDTVTNWAGKVVRIDGRPSQIKSADPVTYDESGAVIPLSQRFNPTRDEISYSVITNAESRIAESFNPFLRNPEQRLRITLEAQKRSKEAAVKFDDIIRRVRSAGSLSRETRVREGLEYDRLLRETFGATTQAEQEALPAVDRAAARSDAAKVAADWKKAQEKSLGNIDRELLIGAMRTLDAMISALPVEIRGKMGGMVRLAQFKGPEALVNELEKRSREFDRVLEKWLKDEATKEAKDFFATVKKKIKTEAGKKAEAQALPEMIVVMKAAEKAFKSMSAEQGQARGDEITGLLLSGKVPDNDVAAMQMMAELIPLFSGWNGRTEQQVIKGKDTRVRVAEASSTAQKFAAIEAAKKYWTEGMLEYKRQAAETKERRDNMREGGMEDVAKANTLRTRDEQGIIEQTRASLPKKFALNIMSFDGFFRWHLGDDSKLYQWVTDSERKAANAYDDAVRAITKSVDGWFTKKASSRFKGEQLREQLAEKKFVITPEVGEVRTMSQLEMITAKLIWRQDDGRRHMEGRKDENGKVVSSWSYSEKFMEQIDKALSDEARALMEFLSDAYDAEYEPLNKVYRKLFGIDLPKHLLYSPLTVKPMIKGDAGVDSITGFFSGGLSGIAGALKTRGSSIVEPDFKDALQTYVSHSMQMEHFKAYAEFSREARAIFGRVEFRDQIVRASGEEGATVLDGLLEILEKGGIRSSQIHLEATRTLEKLTGRLSTMILFGKLQTVALNVTQFAAASAEMGVPRFWKQFGKLWFTPTNWAEALRTPYIQRRIDEMPPVIRQVLESNRKLGPSRLSDVNDKLGYGISASDGFFTAASYAMVYDWKQEQGREMGMTGDLLETWARNETERIVDRIAQPTRKGARSIFENTLGPEGRAFFNFFSEARKNVALVSYAAQKDPSKLAGVAQFVFLNAAISSVIRAAWADLRDDDEEMDELYWNPGKIALEIAIDPLYGIPVVGGMLQDAIKSAFGFKVFGGSIFESGQSAIPATRRALTLDYDADEIDRIASDLNAILGAFGYFSRDAAALTGITNVIEDALKVYDNLVD